MLEAGDMRRALEPGRGGRQQRIGGQGALQSGGDRVRDRGYTGTLEPCRGGRKQKTGGQGAPQPGGDGVRGRRYEKNIRAR